MVLYRISLNGLWHICVATEVTDSRWRVYCFTEGFRLSIVVGNFCPQAVMDITRVEELNGCCFEIGICVNMQVYRHVFIHIYQIHDTYVLQAIPKEARIFSHGSFSFHKTCSVMYQQADRMVDTSEARVCISIPAALFYYKKLCKTVMQQNGC